MIGVGVRNPLRIARKGLRTPTSHRAPDFVVKNR